MRFRLTFLAILICFLFKTAAPQSAVENPSAPRFERLGPFGGDVRSLLIDSSDPSAVYLGTSNGEIYKSADSGKSWRMLTPGIEQSSYVVDTLVQHPRDSMHIYAGAWDSYSEGGGLFESSDAGTTWTRIKLPHEFTDVRGIALCRSTPSYMLVATTVGVFLSKDGGGEWSSIGEGLLTKAHSVAIDPVDPNILYVGTWRLGYVSRDMGKSWTLVENKGMPLDSDIFSMTISPDNHSVVFASACSGVYRSDDGVRTWTRLRVRQDSSVFTIRAHIVYLDPTNSKKVYAGTTEGLYVSENEGRSWTLLTSKDVTVNTVQVDPSNNRLILLGTEYHGVLRSDDGGKTWPASNDGFVHKQIPWIQFDQDEKGRFIAGLHSGGGGWYSRKADGGDWTLEQIEPGLRTLSFLILPNGAGRLIGTPQGIYHRKNVSSPWKKLTGAIAMRTVYSLAIDQDRKAVYAGTDQGIYRAPIDTLAFRMPPNNRLSPIVWRIITPAKTPEIVFAATHLGILRSTDRGTTWKITSAHGLPERVMINSIVVSPTDKDHFFLGTSIGLFESDNGGVYWKQSGSRDMKTGIADILFLDGDEKRILAANQTTGGLFLSEDGGAEWEKIFDSGFASPVYCLAQDPDNPSLIYIGTRYEGVYRLTIE